MTPVVGTTTVGAQVTAEDGEATQTYTVANECAVALTPPPPPLSDDATPSALVVTDSAMGRYVSPATRSISTPNEKWIQGQIASGEFASRSEVINDLIRRVREIEVIRARMIAAEQSGFSTRAPEQILAASKEELRGNGDL